MHSESITGRDGLPDLRESGVLAHAELVSHEGIGQSRRVAFCTHDHSDIPEILAMDKSQFHNFLAHQDHIYSLLKALAPPDKKSNLLVALEMINHGDVPWAADPEILEMIEMAKRFREVRGWPALAPWRGVIRMDMMHPVTMRQTFLGIQGPYRYLLDCLKAGNAGHIIAGNPDPKLYAHANYIDALHENMRPIIEKNLPVTRDVAQAALDVRKKSRNEQFRLRHNFLHHQLSRTNADCIVAYGSAHFGAAAQGEPLEQYFPEYDRVVLKTHGTKEHPELTVEETLQYISKEQGKFQQQIRQQFFSQFQI